MNILRRFVLPLAMLTVVALGAVVAAVADPDPGPSVNPDDVGRDVQKAASGLDGAAPKAPAMPGGGKGMRDIGSAVATAVTEDWVLTGTITAGVAALSFVGWLLASRYVDPKVALRNPQRSMLYGFIKGNPGVHLKQLSNEFHMKTSTVLWHIRKLEHADLVRSKKANGYRVFYPVSGGMEAKQLSEAVTALSNHNAKAIFDYVARNPGAHRRLLSGRLVINPGTVRWHLKKLREAGLIAEVNQERLTTYFSTEIGIKAMRQVAPLPPEIVAPVLASTASVSVSGLELDDEPETILAN